MKKVFAQDDPYVRFLRSRRERRIYVKPWGGNSGDMLIWHGTNLLLDDIGANTVCDPAQADLILIPGGNQTMWPGNVEIWHDMARRFPSAELVVGPCTIGTGYSDWNRFILSKGATVSAIFARDLQSHQCLGEAGLPSNIHTGLSHDPAFYLIGSDLMAGQLACLRADNIVVAFRKDHEAKSAFDFFGTGASRSWAGSVKRKIRRFGVRLARRNKIRHAKMLYDNKEDFLVEDIVATPLPLFLERVRFAKAVHTDRLHCMILASMMSKPVFAYSTGYGKLESVYEHSMKDWADVRFVPV